MVVALQRVYKTLIGQENLPLLGSNLNSKNIKEIKTQSKIKIMNPKNPRKITKLDPTTISRPNSRIFNSLINNKVAF